MRDTIVDLLTGSLMGTIIWFGSPRLLGLVGQVADRRRRGWLGAAIACILVSYFLPSPWFESHTLSFSQHLVGGGVASGLVGYYLMGNVGRLSVVQRVIIVAALVSTLGVANELFELAMDRAFGVGVVIDASWDLFANTVGAGLVVAAVEGRRAFGRVLGRGARAPHTPKPSVDAVGESVDRESRE